ncbi:MAG TPA: hypothetical protein VG052_11145 [Puia sp.]|jgi:hypothetical protein|nr:hypothetical protein [Puia sp.]
MRRSFLYFPILILALVLVSCTKSKPQSNTGLTTDTASIIGTWTWASQSNTLWDTATLTALTTGIQRTLIFDTSGKFTFIHNDSIFQQDYLQVANPLLLLPAMETDTGTYEVSVGIVGCSITDTSKLILLNTPYQLGLSTDTLLVHLDPCLSRVVDIYIRKN